MNPSVFLLGLVFAAVGLADRRLFYAKINGKFEPLCYIHAFNANVLSVDNKHLPNVPPVNLDGRGVVSVVTRNSTKTFGIFNGALSFRDNSTMTPLEVRLGPDSKISNFRPHVCRGPHRFSRGLLMLETLTTPNVTCTPVDLYLLGPSEARRLVRPSRPVSGSSQKHGSSFLSTVFSFLGHNRVDPSIIIEQMGEYLPM